MKKKVKRTHKKMTTATKVIIGCVIVILVPCLVLGFILVQASFKTGEPIVGNRFTNDLDPAITEENLASIKSKLSQNSLIEEVNLDLKTATLRVKVNADDAINAEQMKNLADEVYEDVASVLAVNTYFTTDQRKMYDLEIHLYNDLDLVDSDKYLYAIKLKNANMSEPTYQVVSEPVNAELAKELQDELNAESQPQTQDDEAIGVQEVEDTPDSATTE